ncbi:putative Minor extracellular protease vpr [Seiridium unicorne]|uniref:Minor extracellular protease vpr n=1 Tax=Seiridium unicorne TaxID=138068 RepID=A0ABR2V7U9_9PEZI
MVRTNVALSLLAGAAAFTEAARTNKQVVPGSFIVEFVDTEDSSNFYSATSSVGETTKTFDSSIFKGATIKFHNLNTADAEASNLLSLPSVKNVWPNSVYSLPPAEVIWTGSPESAAVSKRQYSNDTFSPHVMTQVDKLHAEGIIGEGIKIGVIDTGIDYNHPALGEGFGPGHLVSYGYDLVGDNYTGVNTPVPDDDPWDGCAGHGSHVAGIIAAQANELGFTGAAPGVTLGAYRVFGCDGSAANDVLIEAYIRAFEDGSQIITASIGGSSGWSEDPWAVVVSRIVEQGVPCTVSAGNSGDYGLFYASTAADGKKVTAIASFDNVESPALLTVSNYTIDGAAEEEFGYAPGEPAAWTDVSLPLWTPSFNTTDAAAGCDAYPADTPDLSGYIVLIRRGTCTFVQKATNAAAFGAKYILFYNNVAGATTAAADVEGILAVGMVTADQGVEWVNALAAGSEVVLSFEDPTTAPVQLVSSPNTLTGGYLSTYTSWGPTFEADVKPQVGSPGGNILSTWPVPLGSYAVLSGTSMACPLVAAIVALVAEVRGTFDPLVIESLLAATANPADLNDGTGTYDILAPVAQQGAGLVQAYDAAYATTILSVSYLAFNDTDNFVDTLNFTISNTGADEITYEVASVGSATAYTFSTSIFPDIFPGLEFDDTAATLAFSEDKVTVPAGGESVVTVTVTPPAVNATRLPVYSGYITLNGTNGDSFSLPYQGIVGSLHDTTVLADAYLTLSTDSAYTPVTTSNSSFVLYKGDTNTTTAVQPEAVADLAFGSPLVKCEVLEAGSNGTSLGEILGSPYRWASRDPIPLAWNGTLADGSYAPAGSYVFQISALHIFGDASDASEYDVAQSVPFSITYA